MAVFLSMTNYASQMTNNVSRDGVTKTYQLKAPPV